VLDKTDILCVQKKLDVDLDQNLLSFPSFNFESKVISFCSRDGICVASTPHFVRRLDREGTNSHLVIIDINVKTI
jgi:hypothetical protein